MIGKAVLGTVLMTFAISCVGPPEPDRGLIENLPEVYSSENDFSYTLLGDKYSQEAIYAVGFSQDSTVKNYTVLLLVSESKNVPGSSSGITLMFKSPVYQDTLLSFNGNKELIYNKLLVSRDGIPDSLFMDIRSFTGLLEFNLIAFREDRQQIGQ